MPFPVLSPFRYTHEKTKQTGTVVQAQSPDTYWFTPGFTGAEEKPVYLTARPVQQIRDDFKLRYLNLYYNAPGCVNIYSYQLSGELEASERTYYYTDGATGWRSYFESREQAARYLRRIVYEFEPGTLKPADRRHAWALEHERLGAVLIAGEEIRYIHRALVEEVCRTGVVWVGPESGHPWDGSRVTRVLRDWDPAEIEAPQEPENESAPTVENDAI